jgi:hypothetical protein
MMWMEGLGQLKNPMTSSGIEPANVQVVASCLENAIIFLKYKGGFTAHLNILWLQLVHPTPSVLRLH